MDTALQVFLFQPLTILLLSDVAEMLHAFPPPSTPDTQICRALRASQPVGAEGRSHTPSKWTPLRDQSGHNTPNPTCSTPSNPPISADSESPCTARPSALVPEASGISIAQQTEALCSHTGGNVSRERSRPQQLYAPACCPSNLSGAPQHLLSPSPRSKSSIEDLRKDKFCCASHSTPLPTLLQQHGLCFAELLLL